MRDIGALRIASRAPTQSIAAAEQALQRRTAMEPRTRHDQQNGTDAISSRTDASSQPRSARSPPASLLLKFDVQTRGRTRTAKPNEHQANEQPPFVRAPGTSSIVRCSHTRRTTLRMVGKMVPVNLPNPKPQTSTPEPPKSKLTPRARRASCSCGALLRKPSRSCSREAARAALLSRAAALDLRQPTARGTLRLWKAGSRYRLSASTVLL